jgi:hypothetical protein
MGRIKPHAGGGTRAQKSIIQQGIILTKANGMDGFTRLGLANGEISLQQKFLAWAAP